MSWAERSTLSLRTEFVEFAILEGSNIRGLCRRFGISPKMGYKWLNRFLSEGHPGLLDRSRRPHTSPLRTGTKIEQAVLEMRTAHPAWGGRKLRHVLCDQLSETVPSPSTLTEILRRNGRLDPQECEKHKPFQRFEYEKPNMLWQLDFKGDFALSGGPRCHPLTMLDDHARFCLLLSACQNQQSETVKEQLIHCFRTYGLPEKMLMDNGPPWGGVGAMKHTHLAAWLMRLNIVVCHGRPWHPQTQGKEERFHRTLTDELLRSILKLQVRWNQHAAAKAGANQSQSGKSVCVSDHAACQVHFDQWRKVYNTLRPHEGIQMQTPSNRYQPSQRSYPELPVQVDYELDADEIVLTVNRQGRIRFQGREFLIGYAFENQPVAIGPTGQ